MNLKENNKIFTHPLFVIFSALLCCALWGSATPFIKIGYELVMPNKNVPSTILFAGIRFALAGVLTILIYSMARRRFLYPKIQNLGKVGIVAATQTVIQYIFFYVGLSNTTGVKGTIASGSSVFFSILISTLLFKQEKLNLKKIVACILGFAGIIMVNLNGLTLDMNFTGDVFVIFSAASLGFSSVLIKKFSSSEDPVVISGYQFVFGGLFMIIVGLAFGGVITVESFRGFAVIIYLAFLSAIAYSLWGILLKYNPVSKVTIFTCTTPVFGVILSTLMLTENSNVELVNLILSLFLVCLGIFTLNYQAPQIHKSKNKITNSKQGDKE